MSIIAASRLRGIINPIVLTGGASAITSKADLAEYISVSETSIKTFNVVGDTVFAEIQGDFELGDFPSTFENNQDIRFIDLGVGGIEDFISDDYFNNSSLFAITSKTENRASTDEFYKNSNLKYAFFENASTLQGKECFGSITNTRIYLGSLTTLDRIVGGSQSPFSNSTGCKIYVPQGAPNIPVSSSQGEIITITDTTTPNSITDLSVTEIGGTYVKLDFTEIPEAEFYEVWREVNGVFELIGEISPNQKYLTKLNPLTNYKIKLATCNEYWNGSGFFEDKAKQAFSNTINVTTIGNDITISQIDIGGTYVQFDITNTTPYTINEVEVYVDGILNTTIQGNLSDAYAVNLNELTSYDIDIIAKTDENIDLISNTINVTTPAIPDVFQNAVVYLRLDNTIGNPTDLVNNYSAIDVGTIVKDGEYYNYSTNDSYVELADQDDYSFTDGVNNTDFVIKTTVIFDGFNSSNRAWLVSKRESTTSGVQEWQLTYNSNDLTFAIWDVNSNIFIIRYENSFTPIIGQKYILGVTLNGTQIDLFINGVIVATTTLPSAFNFFNGTSPVKLGNETFTSNLNLVGRQKETTILKGQGWSAGDISDNYNNGNGTTY